MKPERAQQDTAESFMEWMAAKPAHTKIIPPDPECRKCGNKFKAGQGEPSKSGAHDVFCSVECQEKAENPVCFQCGKQFTPGTGVGSKISTDIFCSTECQDEYHPQYLSEEYYRAKGKILSAGGSTEDLVKRAEEMAIRAAKEAETYVPIRLRNGTNVHVVPNELLPAGVYVPLRAGDRPTCYKCHKPVWMALTANNKWMPVDEAEDGSFETHFATCGREA